jgi:CHAT domain-containing protein
MGSRPWLARGPVLAWCGVLALAAVPAGAPAQLPGTQACVLQGRCPQITTDPLQRDGFALRLEAVYRGFAAGGVPSAGRTAQDAARDDPVEQISRGNGDVADGRFDAAGERYAAALRLAQARRDAEAEAAAQANLGVLAAAQGRYAQAREKLELAQRLFEALASGATPAQPPAMPATADLLRRGALVGVPFDPSVLAGVAAQTAQAGQFMAKQLRSAALVRARLNLANLAGQLGQYAEAEAQLQQLLAGLTPEQVQEHQRPVLVELAVLYRQAGRTAEAEQFRERAAAAPHTPSLGAFTGGLVALGRGSAAPGPTLSAEGERLRPSHYAEAAHARLLAEAEERERAGDLPAALNAYARAAMLAAVIEAPERERTVLAQLARLHAAQGAGEVAIFHAKRAVNLAQRLRGQLGTLDRQARQAYLADKKRSYALLASALLQRERLAEAEQVLRLLKEDEGQQFAAGPARGERGRIPYDLAETAWLAKYDAVAERTRALEREWVQLQKGLFGALVDARSGQEEMRRRQALQVEQLLPALESGLDPGGDKMRQAQAAAAKPPAARSAAERNDLTEAQVRLRLGAEMLGNLLASLRQFRRDARDFLTPLAAEEAARLDQLAARAEQARAARAAAAEALGPLPAGADPASLGQLAKFLLGGNGDSARQWAIDREFEELDAQRAQLDTALAAELPRAGAAERSFAAADAALLEAGRAVIARLPAGTAAVYYLAGDTQLELLLVQREARRAFRVALPRAELEERIRAFRTLLQNPRSDPRPAARALHDSLIAPLEGALREARASTLMLSLDGQLRYLPFAALHDGQAWLAERYAVNLYTTAVPAALIAAPARRWRAAAFGSTAGGAGFGPLPAVRSELEGVVRDAALGTQGVLPGVIRLDRNFTAAALRSVLREKHQVVHIASHFAFRPGEPAESFLLLGDGGRLTLAEMAAAEYRFDQVDLVTLSACDTALSGADGFGQEVEGLGTLLQGQGAAAVLATLWSVADDSTSQYMRTLYALREQRGLTRAQAVREAQLVLLRRGPAAAGGAVQRGAARADPAAPPRDEPAAPYAHPYFWAPFVLMGNWL